MSNNLSAEQISSALMTWTAENSGYEERRDYLGLSHASLEVDEIVSNYRAAVHADVMQRLKTYKGYQMERDLLRRLVSVYGDRIQPGEEISVFHGLVKGHPDLRIDGAPGDCKTVPLDEHLPQPGRLPRRVFWQMQAYMLYAPAERALVIYESRASGLLWATWIFPVRRIQDEIDAKYRAAVEMILR